MRSDTMSETTRTDGRYSTHTDLVVCENCDEVSIADVRTDSLPGIAAVTCPACDETQEPAHPRDDDGDMIDGAIRTRVLAFAGGVETLSVTDVSVSTSDGGSITVSGMVRDSDAELVRGLAEGCGGAYDGDTDARVTESFDVVFAEGDA